MVVVVCLPLTVAKAVGYFALALGRVDHQAAALIGFAGALTYLAVFLPALVLFEPFAIMASIWYTRRRVFDEPAGRLFVCWLAVIVHTAVLISYFRLGR
jgi:hypothetical protein